LSDFSLRPHHALCIGFFQGKGYSGEFTENMKYIVNLLETENPEVTVTASTDRICSKCPHNQNGVCTSDKVNTYDKKVLELCGLENGTHIKWEKLRSEVKLKILGNGRLNEVCGDCKWQYICGNL